jgi:hypothetical protein
MRHKRQLRDGAIHEELKDWYEYHLLQGLNGRIHPTNGEPKPEAQLPRNASAIERVESLLVALQQATPSSDLETLYERNKALRLPSPDKFLKWVNSQLKQYLQFPVIFVDPFSNDLTTKMKHHSGDEWEGEAVTSILWLLERGELQRLELCFSCKKWFYSLRGGQRFCSQACRQKQHSQSEAFKEKRKRYMQKYRKEGNDKRAKSRT